MYVSTLRTISERQQAGKSPHLGLLVLLAVAAAAPLEALPPANDRFPSIRERLVEELDKGEIPSIAVAVARGDEILWEEAFGWADRERKIPATVHTMYSLASVTKPLTATGLMLLVEGERIDLDRPMNDYLGDAKLNVRIGKPEKVTVRRVANHTAGLPLHYHFFAADEAHPRPPMGVTIRRYGNVVSKPGEAYRYSNLGYGILEHAIERVSGKTFATFMKEEVFSPLEMEHTRIPSTPDPEGRHAVRYDGQGRPLPFYDFDHRGASAAFACVHDLARFGMFQVRASADNQERILSDRSLQEMQKPTARTTEGTQYGLGWEIRDHWSGERIVTHRGGMSGVTASLVLVPSRKITVAVVATRKCDVPLRITEEVLSALLRRHAPASARFRARRVRVERRREADRTFEPPEKLEGTWNGAVHLHDRILPLTLIVEKSGVRVRLGEQKETEVRSPDLDKNDFSGWTLGDIGTEDANRRRYLLLLSLKLRGPEMNGALTAVSLPHLKLPNALSHWVALRKAP